MAREARHSWFVLGLGIASPWLVGMVACNGGAGGLGLPGAAGAAAGRGGSSHGGSGGSAVEPEGGRPEGGGAGSDAPGTGGSTVSTAGSGGSHSHGATGGKGGTPSGDAGRHDGSSGAPDSSGGVPDQMDGGAGGEGGVGNEGSGASAGTVGAGAGGTSGGTGGDAGNGGNAGTMGGLGGVGGQGPVSCNFHTPAPTGGDAGSGPLPGGLAVGTNVFIGSYLTDLTGLALYIYGADLPGDCNTPPVSNCVTDCLQSWPVFDAGARTLPSTLDDALFGSFDRPDGKTQTTYLGWPLYYYKSDTAANMINGQGKGKTWLAAELKLPNIMVLRGPVDSGGVKYLGDVRGHTFYSLAGDTLGSSGQEPVSSCTGSCLSTFLPFSPGELQPSTVLEPADLSLFVRPDGGFQAAYKGAPLYYATSDTHAGDVLGVGVLGGALVAP